jgi:hypothetical protein
MLLFVGNSFLLKFKQDRLTSKKHDRFTMKPKMNRHNWKTIKFINVSNLSLNSIIIRSLMIRLRNSDLLFFYK